MKERAIRLAWQQDECCSDLLADVSVDVPGSGTLVELTSLRVYIDPDDDRLQWDVHGCNGWTTGHADSVEAAQRAAEAMAEKMLRDALALLTGDAT